MIYLDNASTTKMYDEVIEEYNNISKNNFFNASALYNKGLESKNLINKSRNTILNSLGATNFDLVFTGSATEANNMAIYNFSNRKNKNFVFSMSEHPSVFNVAKDLQNKGIDVRFAKLTKEGVVDKEHFKTLIDENTCFVSIMNVCNETGAVNDIKELVKIAKSINKSLIFHSDGVQAFLKIPVNLDNLGVDMYTISSHKVNGPKGVGALIVRKGLNINPYIIGGGQENNKRSGTENVAGICAFGKAVSINFLKLKSDYDEIKNLKKFFYNELKNIKNFVCYTYNESFSPFILEGSFLGVKAETMLHMLEEYGIFISNGSACSSKKQGNRLLESMGLNFAEIESSVRFSFDYDTKIDDLKHALECISKVNENYLKITNKGK